MPHFLSRLLLILFGTIAASGVHAQETPTIAAASDLKFALEEVAAKFKAETHQEVRLNFGSSGNFARQLQQGAPFEMFMSADEGFVFQLADAGKTMDRGILYAEGRIVLFVPKGSPVRADGQLDDVSAATVDGRIQKFAIANPEHAPYGRAAEQALRNRGLWDVIKPKLVLGENVSQAAQFATSGAAQGGIFAYSLALAPAVSSLGSFVLIPAEWHQPLRQRMVLMKNATPVTREFYRYVQMPAARVVFRKFGFILPGEAS
ncbi:molybdate ABC transporter substrate-binding protein [Bradyrhizobium sp. sBnM-33]|uniref:molybdate ABC transporter substrate-binding protein n=1 Tax=Bradyrhizobium sp. sBnM-33 TaxID=2831780 RepID=UPI001BD18C59|nr:molybdate ABC transporter substrate-binding protein [Bradyrhizobium sp. sBnM-33]WOH50468.1 molybdate ABC transporter substrate-binding protein [Bradyrhizobium sp. sBnM-33]